LSPYRVFRVMLLLAACVLLTVDPLLAQEGTTGATLTSEQIQSRIAAVRESQEIDDAARTRAVELYQQAIANLETARANRQATESYRKTAATAPEQIAAIRASIDGRRDVDPVAALGITPAVGLEKLGTLMSLYGTYRLAARMPSGQPERPLTGTKVAVWAMLQLNAVDYSFGHFYSQRKMTRMYSSGAI